MQLTPKIKNIVDDFAARASAGLKDNLVSVILYGSLVGDEYSKRHSDANILIVLNKVDSSSLRSIINIKNRFRFRIIEPLVLGKSHLENSSDTFPIEFLDMQQRYIVLQGADCLKGLKVNLGNLRHQCEWELKSKIVRMQQFYIRSKANNAALRLFLIRTLPSFIVIFKNILRLKGIVVNDKEQILARIAEGFNLDKGLLDSLASARLGNSNIEDVQVVFWRVLSDLMSLSDAVDKMYA